MSHKNVGPKALSIKEHEYALSTAINRLTATTPYTDPGPIEEKDILAYKKKLDGQPTLDNAKNLANALARLQFQAEVVLHAEGIKSHLVRDKGVNKNFALAWKTRERAINMKAEFRHFLEARFDDRGKSEIGFLLHDAVAFADTNSPKAKACQPGTSYETYSAFVKTEGLA